MTRASSIVAQNSHLGLYSNSRSARSKRSQWPLQEGIHAAPFQAPPQLVASRFAGTDFPLHLLCLPGLHRAAERPRPKYGGGQVERAKPNPSARRLI